MSRDAKIQISTELLRRLHHIHRQLTDLQNQLDRGPRQIKAGKAIVAKAHAEVEAARESLQQARIASDDRQLQLKTREDRIEDLKAKLNTAASNREYDLLSEQIAADKQANAVLSDEILEGLEQLDVLQQQVQQAEEDLNRTQSEQKAKADEIEKRMISVRKDLDHFNAEREKAEAEIPSQMKADYLRVTSAKGEDALAPVENESCGGCYQTLTTQTMDQLRLSRLVRCPSCNAFLYLAEDTRVT
jgi:predicted  nucleic acid-binding Zn-ribbon protein